MDVADRELDRMIERRSRQKDPDEQHELWQESAVGYEGRRRDELRAAWLSHHQQQAASLKVVLEALIARHDAAAARLSTNEEGR